MKKKNICHQIALVLAFISIILTVCLLVWGETGTSFIPIFTVSLAVLFENISKNNK